MKPHTDEHKNNISLGVREANKRKLKEKAKKEVINRKHTETPPYKSTAFDTKNKPYRLEFELVPSTTWYSNMRKAVSPSDWDKIRKQVYADYGHRCGICSSDGKMNCHEIWKYDDKDHVQLLVGFIALCDMCHHVKHIGLAGILASRGQLDYQKVVDHYVKVNGCTKEDFEEHRSQAFAKYHERSEYEWKTDFRHYNDLIKDGEKQ